MSETAKKSVFSRILGPVALYTSVAATAGAGAVGALYLQSRKTPAVEENPAFALHESQFEEFSSEESDGRSKVPSAAHGPSARTGHKTPDKAVRRKGTNRKSAAPDMTEDAATAHSAHHDPHAEPALTELDSHKAGLSHSDGESHDPQAQPELHDHSELHAQHHDDPETSEDESHASRGHGSESEDSHHTAVAQHDPHTTRDHSAALVGSEHGDGEEVPADDEMSQEDPFSEESLGFSEADVSDEMERPADSLDDEVAHEAEHVATVEMAEHDEQTDSHADEHTVSDAEHEIPRLSPEQFFSGSQDAFQPAREKPAPELASAEAHATRRSSANQDRATQQASNLISYADEQLVSGNYVQAMRAYQQLRTRSQGPPGSAVLFRLALCAEAAGRHAAALEAYRRISGSTTDPAWAGVARYGEARCLVATGRHAGLQTDLLRRVLLDETDLLPTVRGELLHLIGRDLWHEQSEVTSQDLLNDFTLAVPEWTPDPGQLVSELPMLIHETPSKVGRPEFRVLSLEEPLPDAIRVRLHCTITRMEPLLENLVRGCRLQVSLTEAAAEILEGRSQQIHVNDRTLATLLDGLTIPYDLAWIQEENEIQIVHQDELSPDDLKRTRLNAAERILRAAVIDGPNSRQVGYSRLALSTLLFEQKRVGDAVQFLEVQLETAPRSGVETEVAFNLGKCLMVLNEREESRQAFLRCIDASGGATDVRIAAYIFHSRLLLEDNKGKNSIATMMRGLSLAKGSQLESAAALQLASVYLMLKNPQGANSVLMGRRDEIAESPDRGGAAFVSALARFRAAVLADRREREGWAVVSALSEFKPEDACGGHWAVLTAEACEELGLTQQAMESWRLALKKLPACELRNQTILKLASRHQEEDQLEEARLLLTSVTDTEAGPFIATARLRSAEVALEQDQPDQAIQTCRQLINMTEDAQLEREALRIMGQAYERQRNHEAAMYCFAGMLPEDSSEHSMDASSEGGHKE